MSKERDRECRLKVIAVASSVWSSSKLSDVWLTAQKRFV
jgi:hypothetical protein